MYGAKEAVRRGMADRVGTLDGTIARMARGGGRMAVTAACVAMRRLWRASPRQVLTRSRSRMCSARSIRV